MAESVIIYEILLPASLTFLMLGALFALLLGLMLIFTPRQAQNLASFANRRISMRKPTRELEIPRSVERGLYRHHREIGLFVLLSAAYTLYSLAFSYNHAAAIQKLTAHLGNAVLVSWALEAFLWFILPATLLVLIAGAAIALKPSLLKVWETWGNRWISTRKLMLPLEEEYLAVDNWVFSHPRPAGTLLVMASLYIVSLLLISI